MGVSVEVKGGWRINIFLFFLTGSQSVLLPWSSMILRATGLSGANVGIVMSVVTIAASVGVVGCLKGIKRTHSGAARRLLLLLLLTLASTFYISAVLLLPASAGGNTCMLSPGMPPASMASGNGSLLSNPDRKNLTTLSNQGAISPTSPVEIPFNTSTGNSGIVDHSPSSSSTSLSSSSAKHVEGSSTNNATPTITFNTTLPNLGKINETMTSHEATTVDKHPTQSHTQTKTDHTTTTAKENNIEVTTNKSSQADAKETLADSTPLITERPTNISFMNDSKQFSSHLEETTGPELQTTAQNNPEQKIPSKHKQAHGKQDSESDSTDLESTGTKDEDSNSMTSIGETFSSAQNTSGASGSFATDNQYDDESYDYDDNEDLSDSLASIVHSKAGNNFPSFNNEHNIYVNPPQPPSVPRDEPHKISSAQNYHNRWFGRYDELPPQQKLTGWERALHNSRIQHHRSKAVNVLTGQEEYRIQPGGADYYQDLYQEKQAPNRGEYHPRRQGHPFIKTNRMPGFDLREQRFRKRRSVHQKEQSLENKAITSKEANPIMKEKGHIFNAVSVEDNNLEEGPVFIHRLGIRSSTENILLPINIRVGVAILLILGALLSAGIEVAVAKLWHCYAHGYDEGTINQDILQRTISHTFQLSVFAAHKTWSGFTSGAWVVGGGIIAGSICIMGENIGVYSMLGGVQLALGACAVFMVLVIPVPYGSVDPPRVRKPLSLYLDDEVLREGIRRLAFHVWVLVNGSIAALTLTFGMWIILEMTTTQGAAVAFQTSAIALSLVSESLTLQFQKWLISRAGLHGTMGVGGLAMMFHLVLMWASENATMVVISFSGLGCCMSLLWVSVRNNALLLATVNDQEREAWASWWCWRIGVAIGAVVWGSCVDIDTSLSQLFKPASFIAASVALVVATAAVVTRRDGRTRRRIYHTLDLDMAEDDDEDDDEADEDDWLVKRAKKEGIDL